MLTVFEYFIFLFLNIVYKKIHENNNCETKIEIAILSNVSILKINNKKIGIKISIGLTILAVL